MVRQRPTDARDARYHHGNLREALVDAGVELARAGGPNAVLLRAASRQAGVSHNAVYRHFANQEDLVAAVAQRCMTQLPSDEPATELPVPAVDVCEVIGYA